MTRTANTGIGMRSLARRRQHGVSMLVVLVMLTVMLLGGLSMARIGAEAGLIAGNTAYRDAALQASEVGLADGYAQVQALASEDIDQPAAGYYATRRTDDAAGVPTGIDWSAMPSTTVGLYTVRRVVERLCIGALPVVDVAAQCIVRPTPSGLASSSKAGADSFDAPLGKQYRVTVGVTGPKNTQVFVQGSVIR